MQQALREQNELLLSSAHDLKNLVTPVQVRVDTLRVEATRVGSPERENLAQGLARIELALRRLDRLADDFIDVARLQGGQSNDLHPCPVDLVAAATEATAEWQQTTSRHRLRLSSATPTLVGWWDPSRLARLLDNLVQNAIKYSPEGGDIEVEVERLVERGREWALLRVRDHGLGIPLEEQRHVFTPFRRGANVANDQGLGHRPDRGAADRRAASRHGRGRERARPRQHLHGSPPGQRGRADFGHRPSRSSHDCGE